MRLLQRCITQATPQLPLAIECLLPVAGMIIRTYDADQLFLRVPAGAPNAESSHKVCPRHAAYTVLSHGGAPTLAPRARACAGVG